MCGIAAIVGPVKDREAKLQFALSKIAHRGEYHNESRIFSNVVLGANRLAIVDERLGAQPQQNEDGSVFSIQNGEIFNFAQLQDRLRARGHVFRTQSDTEVLTHLWEEYKEKMIYELDSEMFAFVIYDERHDEVFIARDRLGVKPLYYAFDPDKNLHIASEIKALVSLEGISEVHEFPPGHYYYHGEFARYFSLDADTVQPSDENKLVEALEAAVTKRVQTGLPIAVFLSGGVDSSLVMELATRAHKDVTALILGAQDSLDHQYAVRLCEEKGWQYEVVEPKIDYEAELPGIVYFVETYDPNIVRHSFANDVVSRLARDRGFKIVLTGEGADEMFAGYNEFLDLEATKINRGCTMLLNSMSRGHLMRIDKLAMRYTVETRCPFFDQQLVDLALSIDGSEKVGEHASKRYTKLILRKIASKYLPE